MEMQREIRPSKHSLWGENSTGSDIHRAVKSSAERIAAKKASLMTESEKEHVRREALRKLEEKAKIEGEFRRRETYVFKAAGVHPAAKLEEEVEIGEDFPIVSEEPLPDGGGKGAGSGRVKKAA